MTKLNGNADLPAGNGGERRNTIHIRISKQNNNKYLGNFPRNQYTERHLESKKIEREKSKFISN